MVDWPDSPAVRACQACGAVIEAGPGTIGTQCAYCRSTLVDSDRGRVAIDRVGPFRIPRSAAESSLRAHVANNIWAPNAIRTAARSARVHTDDLRGVLVPFYAYTATVRGTYQSRIGIEWFRSTTRKNEKGEIEKELIRECEWFGLRGSAAIELEDHVVSASTGLSNDETRAIGTFDLGRAYPFDPRLIAGFLAELPSRSRAEVDRDADQSIRTVAEKTVRRRLLPGDEKKLDSFKATVAVHHVQLVLLPVWVASFRVSGKVVRLLINGQTGRCVGKVPVSGTKVALAIILGAAALIAAYILLGGPKSWM